MYSGPIAAICVLSSIFLKYKNYIDGEKHYRSKANDIREEYPLAMFNESLMEYFDACMAQSEGKVKSAGDLVKSKYEDISGFHSVLMKKSRYPITKL